MADDVAVVEIERVEKAERVAHHPRHGVVVVGLRVAGVALADLVDRDHPAFPGQGVEIEVPVGRAVGAVMRAEIAAVEQHDRLARPLVEIARADPLDIDEFRLRKIHFRLPRLRAAVQGA